MATKVRAIREHNNSYGAEVIKAPGTEYDLPDNLVDTLVGAKLVERVEEAAEAGKAKAGK